MRVPGQSFDVQRPRFPPLTVAVQDVTVEQEEYEAKALRFIRLTIRVLIRCVRELDIGSERQFLLVAVQKEVS
jgi:hypothetical protein